MTLIKSLQCYLRLHPKGHQLPTRALHSLLQSTQESGLTESSSSRKRCGLPVPLLWSYPRGLGTMASDNEAGSMIKKAGILQMTSTDDKEANFHQAKSLILKSLILGAEMIFLPECFDYVGKSQELAINDAEAIDGPTIQRYRDLARTNKIFLSLGGFHERTDPDTSGKIRNTHVIIDKEGEIRGQYNKVHLFDVDIPGKVKLQETRFTQPGDNIGPPVETPVGNVGMAICYDLRFPELSLALTQQGSHILTFPSAFTVPTGIAHWETLLRCRAIENQCYVVAAAQVGKHNEKRSSYGHSMVVDPWGTVLVDIEDKPDVQVFDIDLAYLTRRRTEMPVWQHRRHDLYGTIQVNQQVPIDSQESYEFGQVTVSSSQVFYRTALSVAFVNRKPVVPGHVLVTPVRVVERFCDMTPAEISDMFQVVQRVSGVMDTHHGASALTVGVQDGADAGQTIEHVHVHVLPRKPGDFARNDDIYQHLEEHDKDVSATEWRTDDDMSQEAALYRPYFT